LARCKLADVKSVPPGTTPPKKQIGQGKYKSNLEMKKQKRNLEKEIGGNQVSQRQMIKVGEME
jgi:hypothetical protein